MSEQYDKERYRIQDWKSPTVIFWFLNPFGFINELILGHTLPKISLIERKTNRPYYQRLLTPCPHCNTLHPSTKWIQKPTGFKNWFGIYCDHCKGIIPIQRSLTTLLLLAITFPFWVGFKEALKRKWLLAQPSRYEGLNPELNPAKNTKSYWLKMGLFIGFFTFVVKDLILPKEIIPAELFIDFPIWMLFGIFWGYFMNHQMNKKN